MSETKLSLIKPDQHPTNGQPSSELERVKPLNETARLRALAIGESAVSSASFEEYLVATRAVPAPIELYAVWYSLAKQNSTTFQEKDEVVNRPYPDNIFMPTMNPARNSKIIPELADDQYAQLLLVDLITPFNPEDGRFMSNVFNMPPTHVLRYDRNTGMYGRSVNLGKAILYEEVEDIINAYAFNNYKSKLARALSEVYYTPNSKRGQVFQEGLAQLGVAFKPADLGALTRHPPITHNVTPKIEHIESKAPITEAAIYNTIELARKNELTHTADWLTDTYELSASAFDEHTPAIPIAVEEECLALIEELSADSDNEGFIADLQTRLQQNREQRKARAISGQRGVSVYEAERPDEIYAIPNAISPGASVRNGVFHSVDDLPAVMLQDGTREWFKDGVLHRDYGYAAYYPPNSVKNPTHEHIYMFYQDGLNIHQTPDQPAIWGSKGTREWHLGSGEPGRQNYELPSRIRNGVLEFYDEHGVPNGLPTIILPATEAEFNKSVEGEPPHTWTLTERMEHWRWTNYTETEKYERTRILLQMGGASTLLRHAMTYFNKVK